MKPIWNYNRNHTVCYEKGQRIYQEDRKKESTKTLSEGHSLLGQPNINKANIL